MKPSKAYLWLLKNEVVSIARFASLFYQFELFFMRQGFLLIHQSLRHVVKDGSPEQHGLLI